MRNKARERLHRVKELIAQDDEIAASEACLSLRFAIEYIVYSHLEAYLAEVSDDTLLKCVLPPPILVPHFS